MHAHTRTLLSFERWCIYYKLARGKNSGDGVSEELCNATSVTCDLMSITIVFQSDERFTH